MTKMMSKKVVLIAEAGVQPGTFLARKFADDGARLVLMGCDSARIKTIAEEINAGGGIAWAQAVSELSHEGIQEAIKAILKRESRIDVLINNTGHLVPAPLDSLTSMSFHATIQTALGLPFAILQAVIAAMRQCGSGRVINISSLDYLGLSGKVNIAAAQAGIFGLTRAAALEVARDHVTINNLVLGDLVEESDAPSGADAVLAGSIPVKRLGSYADVAHAASFFASEVSKYVTGQTFFVCGGKSVHFSMSI